MAIKEKVTFQDVLLYEILRHPVLSGEFIDNIDKTPFEKEIIYTMYQKEFACDFNDHVSISCARAVGKTYMLREIIIWLLINNIFPSDYVVYTVPNKAQLEPVWNILTRSFRTNSFLQNYLEPKKGINSSSYQIKLLNGAFLLCRIAGQSGDGVNVIGLHSPFVILDEGGYYAWGTFLELQPIVNTWQTGYRVMVSGVPTGLRENNVLYHADQENTSYTKHNISAFDNPRFSDEDEERAAQQYGGRDSEDYAHFVLGKHGTPLFAVFDRRLLKLEQYPVYKLNIDGINLRNDIKDYYEKLALLPPIPPNGGVIMGIDLGYTEPSAVLLLYLDKHTGVIRFHARIQLNKVSYNLQDRLIDSIDTRYKPIIIGIDEGNAGKHVVQRLQESEDFAHKDYAKRLIPINFSSMTVIGIDLDGTEIKSRTKPFSVSVLQDYSNNHKIIYSATDPDMITELERMTYSKNPTTGDISYKTLTPKGGKKGEDHHTAALLSGILAYYLETELLSTARKSPKLFTPRWLSN